MSKVTLDASQFNRLVDQLGDLPTKVMGEAYDYFKAETPIRSGNARSNTKKQLGGTSVGKSRILADYAYADRLDNGWSSQAPDGMSEPTIRFIEEKIDRALRRL